MTKLLLYKIHVLTSLAVLVSMPMLLSSQAVSDSIHLANPSFEDVPHAGTFETKGIRYWTDCGRFSFPTETPPDIHGVYTQYFDHNHMPSHGATYLSMVSRSNDSYESVSQRLNQPLEAGTCYTFAIDLMRSDHYMSGSKENQDGLYNYNQPIVLYIYGGSGVCGDDEVLAVSDYVKNTDWQTYTFNFRPTKSLRFITLVASYKRPTLYPYNGNILLDNAQPIIKTTCPEDQWLAAIPDPGATPVPAHKQRNQTSKPKKKPTETDIAIAESNSSTVKVLDLDIKKIKVGQKIEIKNLFFKADSSRITEQSYPVLDELYTFMKSNKEVQIEIGGHTNNLPAREFCDSLSTGRARAVANYLMLRGIGEDRLTYKGYGKRQPIASNLTKEGRRRNQRVEIKILKTTKDG